MSPEPAYRQIFEVRQDLSNEEKLKVLLRAEELLDGGKRWIKGAWYRMMRRGPRGGSVACYCLDGAIARAMVDLGYATKTSARWKGYLGYIRASGITSVERVVRDLRLRKGGVSWDGVPDFNDSDKTTWAQVEAVLHERQMQLRRAIERGRA